MPLASSTGRRSPGFDRIDYVAQRARDKREHHLQVFVGRPCGPRVAHQGLQGPAVAAALDETEFVRSLANGQVGGHAVPLESQLGVHLGQAEEHRVLIGRPGNAQRLWVVDFANGAELLVVAGLVDGDAVVAGPQSRDVIRGQRVHPALRAGGLPARIPVEREGRLDRPQRGDRPAALDHHAHPVPQTGGGVAAMTMVGVGHRSTDDGERERIAVDDHAPRRHRHVRHHGAVNADHPHVLAPCRVEDQGIVGLRALVGPFAEDAIQQLDDAVELRRRRMLAVHQPLDRRSCAMPPFELRRLSHGGAIPAWRRSCPSRPASIGAWWSWRVTARPLRSRP